jgi:trehalose 6-phosphate synthase
MSCPKPAANWSATVASRPSAARCRPGVFPIGIDVEGFLAARNSPQGNRTYDRMAASAAFRSMMVGVDRLDYSKGLEERMLGYEQYLHDNPETRGDVFLVQVTPISRDDVDTYQDIRARLDALAGRINGEYADMDWQPIRYLNRGYRRDQLAGIYRAARVGLVTPLRDGMNLVAKEYVAAQNPEDPGVLILSRFAGAAEQMGEALLVNPFSREELSDAIKKALTMPLEERIRKWTALMKVVRDTDVAVWRDDYVNCLTTLPITGDGDAPFHEDPFHHEGHADAA